MDGEGKRNRVEEGWRFSREMTIRGGIAEGQSPTQEKSQEDGAEVRKRRQCGFARALLPVSAHLSVMGSSLCRAQDFTVIVEGSPGT